MSEELNLNPEELTVNNELEQAGDSQVEASGQEVDQVGEVIAEVEEQPSKRKEKITPVSMADSLKNFDWDSIGKKHELYDPGEKGPAGAGV